MTHQLATGRTATFMKLVFAGVARVAAAFAAFALTAFVTRSTSNDEAGLFLLGLTLHTVLLVFFLLGLDNVILRFLSARGTDDIAQQKLNRGLLWIATASIPATILGMALSEPIASHLFSKPNFAPVLFWMLPALPSTALFFLISFAFQAQHRVVLTTTFQTLGVSTLFVAGFGCLWLSHPEAVTAVLAAQIYSTAAIITLLVAVVLWFEQKNVRFKLCTFTDPELFRASMHLWTASLMWIAVQWSGILIAGAVLPSENVAMLSAAQRTAMLISFALVVVNMVVAPKYARLWEERNVEKIQYLAKWSTRGLIGIVLPLTVLIVAWSEKVMGMFGDGYEEAAILLTVLVAGQFVNVATGSVGYLLNMSGHEKDMNLVTLFSGPLTIVLALVLTNYHGALGAAIATAVGVSVQNIGALVMVKVRLGFSPLG